MTRVASVFFSSVFFLELVNLQFFYISLNSYFYERLQSFDFDTSQFCERLNN